MFSPGLCKYIDSFVNFFCFLLYISKKKKSLKFETTKEIKTAIRYNYILEAVEVENCNK